MSKQIVKSLMMLTLVVGFALAATVVANGQTQAVTANIPFDFIVANQTLPAGHYSVRSATSDGQGLKVSNLQGKGAAMVLGLSTSDRSEKRTARMIFHRYGQQYFLAEVWSGESYGSKLNQCKRERNLRREIASTRSKSDVAQARYEVVEVVAQVR